MTGLELKRRFGNYGLTDVEFSQFIDRQRIDEIYSSDDVSSSEIEELCLMYKLPVSCVYGEKEDYVRISLQEYTRLVEIQGKYSILNSLIELLEEKLRLLEDK